MAGDPNGTGKVGKLYPAGCTTRWLIIVAVIHHFTCRSLSIGTWRRVGQNAMDLVIFYSPDKACLTYYINNDSAGYKIEFPFAYIKSIQLEPGETGPNVNGSPPRPGGLVIELNRPPNFFMDSSGSGGFYQCGDFTEEQQASQILTHHPGGHPKVLSGQLAKLVSLESFQNRLSPFDPPCCPRQRSHLSYHGHRSPCLPASLRTTSSTTCWNVPRKSFWSQSTPASWSHAPTSTQTPTQSISAHRH